MSIQRQLLNVKTNENDIYYKAAESAEVLKQEPPKASTKLTARAPSPDPVTASPTLSGPLTGHTGSELIAKAEDVPVKAEDIILTIIAKNLKKAIKDVSLQSTIKTLVGGMRSTQGL